MDVYVTSKEATARFPDLLKRVREQGESFVVQEDGQAVCTIRPANPKKTTTLAELVAGLQRGPHADEEYCKAVEDFVAEINRPKVPESPWER